jgi:putative spermidine/putrescine transport system permease protein
MILRSVTDPSPSNYLVMASSSVYWRVLLTTLRTGVTVTLVCLLLGYPYAYAMHRIGGTGTQLLAALVILPFWSSLLVRTYAWTVLLQDTGVINSILLRLAVIHQPIQLMRNTLGVTIGMVHILLPFMVLPLYAVMHRVDDELLRAASGLGAVPRVVFRRVFLPLTMPGVLAGSLLVFVLSVGFYITPALLGSPRDMMFSELIYIQVTQLLNFGVGSALATSLLVLILVIVWLGSRRVSVRDVFGAGVD